MGLLFLITTMNRQFLIIAIIAALAIYLLGLFTCNGYYKRKYQCPTIKADTIKIYASDTGNWHHLDSSTHWDFDTSKIIASDGGAVKLFTPTTNGNVEIIQDGIGGHLINIDTKTTDSISIIKSIQKQYSDLLNAFYTINKYTDTTHLKNGIVKVQSVVQRNKLMAQRVILDSAFETTITKTSTPISLKEKTQLWAGIDLYGNKHDYLSGAGISAMLKFPHIAITAGTYFDQYNNINYSAGIKWLIKFKK